MTGVWRICSTFPKFSSMTVSCIGCTTGLLKPALGLEFCRGKCCVDWKSCDRISSKWRAQGPVAPLQPQKLAMGKLYGFGVELPGMWNIIGSIADICAGPPSLLPSSSILLH